MRNINTFTIAYPANYSDPNNPNNINNAATTLIFGYEAYHADVPSNSSYWKFPGIQISRTGTTHAAILIDRGIVLTGPAATPARLGAFVTFNGDSFGGDSGTFWADLSMLSPVSGNQNVYLRSGTTGSGDAYFSLFNQNGVKMFEVTTAGVGGTPVATIGGSLANLSRTLIDTSGNFVGVGVNVSGPVTASGNVTGAAFYVGGTQVINGSGQFVGPSISVSGAITAASVTATGNVAGGAILIGGATVINNSGAFVGAGGILTTGNAGALSYNIVNSSGVNVGPGRTWTIQIPGGFTIAGVGSYTSLVFMGGILVSAT